MSGARRSKRLRITVAADRDDDDEYDTGTTTLRTYSNEGSRNLTTSVTAGATIGPSIHASASSSSVSSILSAVSGSPDQTLHEISCPDESNWAAANARDNNQMFGHMPSTSYHSSTTTTNSSKDFDWEREICEMTAGMTSERARYHLRLLGVAKVHEQLWGATQRDPTVDIQREQGTCSDFRSRNDRGSQNGSSGMSAKEETAAKTKPCRARAALCAALRTARYTRVRKWTPRSSPLLFDRLSKETVRTVLLVGQRLRAERPNMALPNELWETILSKLPVEPVAYSYARCRQFDALLAAASDAGAGGGDDVLGSPRMRIMRARGLATCRDRRSVVCVVDSFWYGGIVLRIPDFCAQLCGESWRVVAPDGQMFANDYNPGLALVGHPPWAGADVPGGSAGDGPGVDYEGSGAWGGDGDRPGATFNSPEGISVVVSPDGESSALLCDWGNNALRRVQLGKHEDVESVDDDSIDDGASGTSRSDSGGGADGAVKNRGETRAKKERQRHSAGESRTPVETITQAFPLIDRLTGPNDIAPDSEGGYWISHHHKVLRVSADGANILTCGRRNQGHVDGVASGAAFANPRGLAPLDNALATTSRDCGRNVSGSDGVLVADEDNGCVRHISQTGRVTTVVGSSKSVLSSSLCWRSVVEDLYCPHSVAFDGANGLLVCDYNQLYRVSCAGVAALVRPKGLRVKEGAFVVVTLDGEVVLSDVNGIHYLTPLRHGFAPPKRSASRSPMAAKG